MIPVHCSEAGCRPEHRRGTQTEASGLAELKRTEAVVQGGKGDHNLWDKIPARRELHGERSGDLGSVSLVTGQGLICVSARGN